ncbi:hypothetical protein FRC00_011425, partial [Tulasnella sp. 408]
MSYNPGDDFASLVSRANPAAQQNPYGQPGRNTYAPQAGSSQPTLAPSVDDRYKLDPFFDDDDEQQTPHATATTFPPSVSAPTPRHPGRQPSLTILDEPLDSSADLPLTKAAAPPAGRSFNDAGSSGMQQQNTWTFDDDEGLPAPNSRYERGGQPRNAPLRQRTKRTWKWPWERQKALAPERKIWLNDHPSNEAEGYCSNYVSTTKYNLVTFVPKFLLEQFSKYANVFFLFTGLCYIETSNLDGETNLKIKQASPKTAQMTSPQLVQRLQGYLRSEQPNNSLYTYEGTLVMTVDGTERQVPMSPDQILLRGAQLRNTPWVYGLVVFTGHETKLMRNATATPIKRTAVERQVNVQIVFLFLLLIVLSLVSTIGSSIRSWFFSKQEWYLFLDAVPTNKAKSFVEDILTFVILYNNLIPISLIVTMEVVKFQQAQLINSDLDMYYAKTDTPALCRTSSLVEELGQIEYIFSDKTGTLTRNEMEFRMCSVAGVMYAETSGEADNDEGSEAKRTFDELKVIAGVSSGSRSLDSGGAGSGGGKESLVVKEFLTLLAVCHTVIPEVKGEKIVYQASSPDEAALVSGAELLGFRFH